MKSYDLTLNDLLDKKGIATEQVLVLRHTPTERMMRRKLPYLAAEKPELFNAYQQTQGATVEAKMKRAKYVASFIGPKGHSAIFVGLYEVGRYEALNEEQFWQVSALAEMKRMYGLEGFRPDKEGRTSLLWFDLKATDHFSEWKGKLLLKWPSPEVQWAR